MPGVNVNITSTFSQPVQPNNTGKWFVIGQTEKGSSTEAIFCNGMQEVATKIGKVLSASYLYNSLEEYFAEGGTQAVIGRTVGAESATASVVLKNVSSETVLKVSAKSPGEWGNNLKVNVKAESSKFSVTVKLSGEEVEKVTELASQAAAVEWSEQTSKYVTIIKEAHAGNPAEAESTLINGKEGTLETTGYETSLKLFKKDYGCGQVSAPGVTTEAVQKAVQKHGEENNRTPIIDQPLEASKASLITDASPLRTAPGAKRSCTFSTWVKIPGLSSGTFRTVPYSAVYAGILARNDGTGLHPAVNEASAGENGVPRNVVSLYNEFTRTEREELNEKGINAVRKMPSGQIRTYGDVTLIEPTGENYPWKQITAARLFMYVSQIGEEIMEQYTFKTIDPHRSLFARCGIALQGFLESLGNQIYNNPAEAVDTGPSVNTEETIKKKEVVADIAVKPSPTAETAVLNLAAQGV